jgi:hypothetical protein
VAARRLWVLNLDAERELAKPLRYQPDQATLKLLSQHRKRAHRLLQAGDGILTAEGIWSPEGGREHLHPLPTQGEWLGEAWCPTPWALAQLARQAGVVVPKTPSLECLRQVNGKDFAVGLRPQIHERLALPPASGEFFTDETQLLARLADAAPAGWLLKRRFGFAGRGQRRITRALIPDDARWIRHSMARGGVVAEPIRHIELEVSIHGRIAGASCVLGPPQRLRMDRAGRLGDCRPLRRGEVDSAFWTALEQAASDVATALVASGYWGPFGVDAYVWSDAGAHELQPVSEINARYTMAYPLGLLQRV